MREYKGDALAMAAKLGLTPRQVRCKAARMGLSTYHSHKWTEAEKDVVRQEYAGNTASAQAIADKLGLRVQQVKGQIQALGIREGSRPWTEDELEYLADSWGRKPDEEICRHLRRTRAACILAVKRKMNVNRKTNIMTARELARVFGIPCSKTITVTWVEKGFIAPHRSPNHCGVNKMWDFLEADVKDCLRARPWLVDMAKMEDHTIYRKIVQQEWDRDPWYRPDQVAKMTRLPLSNLLKQLNRGHIKSDKKPGAAWSGEWIVRRSAINEFLARRVRGMSTCKCGHTHYTHRTGGGKCSHTKFMGAGVPPARCRCRKYKPTHLFILQSEVTAIEWTGDNKREIREMLPIGSLVVARKIEGLRHLGVDVLDGDSFDLVPGDWMVKTPGRRVFTMPMELFLELFYAKGERVPLQRRRNYRATQKEEGAE